MIKNSYSNPAYTEDNAKVEGDSNGVKNDTVIKPKETDKNLRAKERLTWENSTQFLMSCIAMIVGLGNVWRFPFVAYENGGGAFLIPYLLVLIFVGRPMYYLELCLGQFSSRGNVKMFESLAPILKGIGFGQAIGNAAVGTYYCALISLSLFYLIHSFTSNLPWAECNPAWANHSLLQNMTCVASNSQGGNALNHSISSSELWFRIEVLQEILDISNGVGSPDWRLTLCLLASWALAFCFCVKGVRTTGKASYFLAIFPYVILFALLIRTATLEGAGNGILYFIEPRWEMLLNAKVWYSAVSQCFFSLNIGSGVIIVYASYNNFQHNIYRDANIITSLDTLTSLLSGFIIFGILGNLAFKMNVNVDDVVTSGGIGLAFISYPEAVARFDVVPWLFAILFFVMLFVLGLGSLVGLLNCASTVILDSFTHLKIWHVSLGFTVVGFLVGLAYTTPGGQWIFTMVDFFGGTFIFYVLTIVEIVSVMWWYGLENICLDIEFMLKKKPGPYWRVCWGIIIPVVLTAIILYFLITLEVLKYQNLPFPSHVIAWGWALMAFGLVQPLLWFLVELFRRKNKKRGKVLQYFIQHEGWGPKDQESNKLWKNFKEMRKFDRIGKDRNCIVDKLCMLIGK